LSFANVLNGLWAGSKAPEMRVARKGSTSRANVAPIGKRLFAMGASVADIHQATLDFGMPGQH
jgi:hypothetical protein